MQVLKFGGSSLATAERMAGVCDIVIRALAEDRVVVVVSALGGVTDTLVAAIEAAVRRQLAVDELVDRLAVRHREQLDELVDADAGAETERIFEVQLAALRHLLDGVNLLGECPPAARHQILCAGERLSAPLVAAALEQRSVAAESVDGTALITTDTRGEIDPKASARRIVHRLAGNPRAAVPVVTGFIAADPEGRTMTLGRGGSDHTATVLASALGARLVEIWSDVDGVLSADPRVVSEARPVPRLDFGEAAELAFFGAKVLHPKTIAPVESAGIPVTIRNTLRPAGGRTLIAGNGRPQPGIRAVAALGGASLLILNGGQGLRATGRTMEVLARLGVRPLHLSQASSDQSLRLVLGDGTAVEVERELRDEFQSEIRRGELRLVPEQEEVAVIAAVGGLHDDYASVGGEMLGALGRGGVRVLAVASGASDHSFSVVVKGCEAQRATELAHRALVAERRTE